jgi:hypothetical protein
MSLLVEFQHRDVVGTAELCRNTSGPPDHCLELAKLDGRCE